MGAPADIVICGTGNFAARILFDLAATSPEDLAVAIVGRDAQRLHWLRTAAQARAALFGTPVRIIEHVLPALAPDTMAGLLAALRPRVVANTASVQGGRAAGAPMDAWARLVQQAGLGVTAALQAALSIDIADAVTMACPEAAFVNCCYPDVVNPMLAASRRPIACGIGNVAILAHAFAGALGPGHGRLHLLAQHAALAAFRRPAAERDGPAPLRLWIDGREITDVFARFAAVKLAPEPVIDISGASGVPLFRALARGTAWRGHVPGPNGLAGGFPVRLTAGRLDLDLPPGLSADAAIAWNAAAETANGVIVAPDGRVRYAGRVAAALRAVSPDLADGFHMAEFAAARAALAALRDRLRAQP
jgi:hypothetical protein